MMKEQKIQGWVSGVLLAVLLAVFSFDTFAQKKKANGSIRTFKTTYTAQNETSGGRFLDLKKRVVYNMEEAGYNQSKIDVVYLYGRNTGANLMSPTSDNIKSFGYGLKEKVFDVWTEKNYGMFINLGNDINAQQHYQDIKSDQQIEELYKEYQLAIRKKEGYKNNVNGPANNIRQISIGDIIIFYSSSREFYAIGHVQSLVKGYKGTMQMEWKTVKKIK